MVDARTGGAATRPDVTRAALQTAVAGAAAWGLAGLADAPWAEVRIDEPLAWLTGQPADAVMALARLAALGVAAWVLLSVLVLTVAVVWARRGSARRSAPAARIGRMIARVAPPAVRRLAEAALATSVVTAGLLPPVSAAASARPPVVVTAAAPAPPGVAPPPPPESAPSRQPTGPPTARPGGTSPTRQPTGPPRTPAPRPEPAAPDRPAPASGLHRVRPGESLWIIAEDRLAGSERPRGDPAWTRRVARYWLRVVAANRGRLPSGDPDLIHPGERIRLPAPRG